VNRTLSESKREFIRRLQEEWLPGYCNDPKRNYSIEGFCIGDDALTEQDAHDFLRALDSGVVVFADRQRLKMAHGLASETLFWEGERKISPRPISLWLETVITVAAAGRLQLDYRWPAECLGMQSKDSAFDLMAFKPPDFVNEYVAAEVKKNSREIDRLLANLTKCCAGEHDPSCNKGSRMNAHRKWIALQAHPPSLFWAVGPSPDSRLFEVLLGEDASLRLHPVATARLHFNEIS
jgi:hypothetical protein